MKAVVSAKKTRHKSIFSIETEFHLLRFFTRTSLVAFLVVALLMGALFRTLSIGGLVKQYEREHASHARLIAKELWDSDLAALVKAAPGKSATELKAAPELPALRKKMLSLQKGTNIFKLKVYDLTGMTLYSPDPKQIGEDQSKDQGTISALLGQSRSVLLHKEQFDSSGHQITGYDVVETYVPAYHPTSDQLVAVFEVYSDVTAQLADVDEQKWIVIGVVIALLTALFAALFAIVHKAQTVIVRQNLERDRAQSALAISEKRWEFALEGSGAGVWDRDMQSGEAVHSKHYKELYGFTDDDLTDHPKSWGDERVHPQDLPAVKANRAAYFSGQMPFYSSERRMLCKDGSWKWILSRGMVVARDVDGKPLRMIGTHTDISERKQAEEKLLLAASVFKHAREGIMITAADGDIIDVNEAFGRITGFSRDEVLGHNPRILNSGRQGKEFYTSMWHGLLQHGHWSGEIWNRRKSGEVYAEILTISAVRDGHGKTQHYVALFTDITPLKEHQRQLEHIAHYDVLTDLPNRVLLADRLHQAMIQRGERSVAVVYLDLDSFKTVNDQHGHDVGDELLIVVSARMKTVLRESDTLARIGGDEFVAVLAALERPQDCELVLERLRQAAAEPVTVGDVVVRVSASIGVAFYPQDGQDADLLMYQADQAMYAAKRAGKNRVVAFSTIP